MSRRVLKERELTRLSYLASSLCHSPHLWERFLLMVTGHVRGDIFYRANDLCGPPEFEDAVNGMWDAFATSRSMSEAAKKLVRQNGARMEAGYLLQHELDLNHKGDVDL